jgi:hypothetical protein
MGLRADAPRNGNKRRNEIREDTSKAQKYQMRLAMCMAILEKGCYEVIGDFAVCEFGGLKSDEPDGLTGHETLVLTNEVFWTHCLARLYPLVGASLRRQSE